MKSKPFASLGISDLLAEALQQQGYTEPTPIQQEAIPVVLAGNDVIAQAQTGTGKTLAFVLPILENIDLKKNYTQALIVTPTRELAIQIAGEVQKWAPLKGVGVLAAYGGQDVERQLKKLEGTVHLIIATPGRLLDHLRRGTVQLGRLSTLVLDEADQMLHMGFLKEVEEIIIQTSPKRQTLLFSATMPGPIRNLAKSYMRSPQEIKVKSKQVTLTEIQQVAIKTTDRAKQDALVRLMEEYRPFLCMIFCRTKLRASKLNEALQEMGYVSDELHGDLTQAKREQVMKRFRDAKIQFLVATDIAARGLDVEGITHVFNYDMPQDVESYIHRIGRTGRAGQRGMAVTMVTPRDQGTLEEIERGINAQLPRRTVKADGEFSEVRVEREARADMSTERESGERGGRGRGREQSAGRGRGERAGGGRSGRPGAADQRQGRGARAGSDRVAGVSSSKAFGGARDQGVSREAERGQGKDIASAWHQRSDEIEAIERAERNAEKLARKTGNKGRFQGVPRTSKAAYTARGGDQADNSGEQFGSSREKSAGRGQAGDVQSPWGRRAAESSSNQRGAARGGKSGAGAPRGRQQASSFGRGGDGDGARAERSGGQRFSEGRGERTAGAGAPRGRQQAGGFGRSGDSNGGARGERSGGQRGAQGGSAGKRGPSGGAGKPRTGRGNTGGGRRGR